MRYRLTPAQRIVPFAVAGVIVMVALQAIYLSTEGKIYPAEAGETILLGIVAGAANLVFSREYGITLNRDEVVIHGSTPRRVPRSEITAVDIEKVLGQHTVVLIESAGRRTRLRAPIGLLDPSFARKAAYIADWSKASSDQ